MSYLVVSENKTALSVATLEEIYRSRYRRFLRVALAILGDRETAHEVVQEAFAQAIRSRFTFRGEGSPESWLWAIVTNRARALARRRPVEPLGPETAAPAVSNGHASEWVELRAAVAALPERQRLVVFLRHYADLDYEQIGEILQIERGTVAATLHAAHAKLRKQLREVPR